MSSYYLTRNLWPKNRFHNRTTLACIVSLHMAAALFLMQKRHPCPAETPQVFTVLLRQSAKPATTTQASTHTSIKPARRSVARTAPASASVPDIQAPPVLTVPMADQEAETQPPDAPPPSSASGFQMDLIRRQVGSITREIAKELPPLPADPDTKWTRFSRALEDAHVEHGINLREDSYTAPDGVTIYRKRIGGRTLCRMTGSVGALNMQSMKDHGEAGWVQCPTSVQWKRLP